MKSMCLRIVGSVSLDVKGDHPPLISGSCPAIFLAFQMIDLGGPLYYRTGIDRIMAWSWLMVQNLSIIDGDHDRCGGTILSDDVAPCVRTRRCLSQEVESGIELDNMGY